MWLTNDTESYKDVNILTVDQHLNIIAIVVLACFKTKTAKCVAIVVIACIVLLLLIFVRCFKPNSAKQLALVVVLTYN